MVHFKTLGEGSFFGEGALVFQRRSCTARADRTTEVLVWEFTHARRVMERYPALWVKLKIIANRRREQLLNEIRKCVPAGWVWSFCLVALESCVVRVIRAGWRTHLRLLYLFSLCFSFASLSLVLLRTQCGCRPTGRILACAA